MWNLLSCRSISTAPPRGGGNFLCCCKESHQRKQLSHRPRSHAVWPFFSSENGPRLKSAPIGPIGLGSRTVRHIAPPKVLVQPFQVPARFAADGLIGYASALVFRWFPSHTPRQRAALCRSYLVLNQRAQSYDLSDRARSKPGWACEGTL